ncbi:type II toxin-antitoxin system Phd/YefM family antitoxin [Candidatus Falkowbacteria bacterium]|jgi:hypothetical protein|nr:type II toxin-antitoxin system Phd/YefM family antitoxin [Candidatus Falkowbacteria bacterium]MBT5503319.1 type II toxin-antitoxin system Phd/YefM family antitoxin [Candidatus Falkowbacteria bacterium]MBT6573651.1 type II toxin-antitoxin system Phd/YefM family antitoxin [Candidatus Falkowbacteria bacterium]MBT7348276.1 type II toxin-antitoxin system Phd/YefM family antitoxin [Candidatus Falkowbacteria bacterium]MBT7500122.1 type II toxin-antitoxin system Phd/YefM family antitoxin [Candidatus
MPEQKFVTLQLSEVNIHETRVQIKAKIIEDLGQGLFVDVIDGERRLGFVVNPKYISALDAFSRRRLLGSPLGALDWTTDGFEVFFNIGADCSAFIINDNDGAPLYVYVGARIFFDYVRLYSLFRNCSPDLYSLRVDDLDFVYEEGVGSSNPAEVESFLRNVDENPEFMEKFKKSLLQAELDEFVTRHDSAEVSLPELRTVTATYAHKHLFEIIRNVIENGARYVISRYDKPIAQIVPPEDWVRPEPLTEEDWASIIKEDESGMNYPCAMAECFPEEAKSDGLQMNQDPEWLEKMAKKEDGGIISVGGPVSDIVEKDDVLDTFLMLGGQTADDYLRQAFGVKKYKAFKLSVRKKQLELGRKLSREEFNEIYSSVVVMEDIDSQD